MKNFSLILNIVLFVAVILLYIDRFANNKNKANNKTETETTTNSDDVSQIVYVNLDTLLDSYGLYNDLMLDYYSKKDMLESQLKTKYASLERKSAELQQQFDSKLITTAKAQEKQQELGMEQQQIAVWQQEQSLALSEDEANINQRVYDSIQSVIKEYNLNKGHKLILSNSYGGVLLYGNKNLDITSTISDDLNKNYTKKSVKDSIKYSFFAY